MPGTGRSFAVVALAVVLVLVVSISFTPAAAADDVEEGEKAMRRGIELLREGKRQEALDAFDTAIERAPEAWQPYFHRGRLLGTTGRFREAREDFYTVMRLQPLLADAYSFAAFASAEMGEYGPAWDLAIAAHHLGADMSGNFEMLGRRSQRPGDFRERLDARRIFVSERVGVAQGGGAEREDPASRITTGDTTGGLDLDSIPRPPRRQTDVAEAAAELGRLVRRARMEVAVRPDLAPASSPGAARYILEFDVAGVDDEAPRGAWGKLVLTDTETDEEVYSEAFDFDDLSSGEEVEAALEEHLSRLAASIRR